MNKVLSSNFLLILVIFIASSIFRFFFLDLIEFKYDEAFTVFQLEQFYAHPYLMQNGPPQSTGVYNPPLFNYLMTVLSLISRNPQFLSFIIALVNIIFIVIFYFVVKKFYGQFVAVSAGLIYAFSPWSIIFSRKIWIPDLVFPLVVVFFYYLHQLLLNKKEASVFPLFIILALLPQLHASGLFFLLTTLIILIILRKSIKFKSACIGFVIGLIPAIPYFIRQLTSTPFCIDCQAFLQYQNTVKAFDWNNFLRPLQLLNGANFEIVLGKSYPEFLQMFPILEYVNKIFYLQYLILLAAVHVILKKQRQYLFLLLYPLVLPALYLFSKTPSYMHYFIILNPILILLFALSLKHILEITHVGGRLMCVIFLAFILLANLIFTYSFFQFLKVKQNIDGDYGPVYSVTNKLIEQETNQYQLLPDFAELKSYAFMFAHSPILHSRLGEYFMQKGQPKFAAFEFEKALQKNEKDVFARANLAYIKILGGNYDEAEKHLNILNDLDATMSARLRDVLKNKSL